MKDSFRSSMAGFTLIELLVVLSIMAVLLGISIPAYNTFNTRQKMQQTRDTIVETLRSIQNKATAGVDKNSDGTTICPATETMDGYYAKIDPSASSIVSGISCSSAAVASHTVNSTQKTDNFLDSAITVPSKSVLLDGVSVASPQYILFRPVAQNVVFYTVASGLPDFRTTPEQTAGPTLHTLSFEIQQGSMSYTIVVTSFGDIYAQ